MTLMFQKIKDLMEIRTEMDNIKSSWSSTKESIDSIKSKFVDMEKELQEVKQKQKEFLTNFREKTDETKALNEELEREVHQFKVLKSQLQNKLVQKFEEELKNELKINIDKLKMDFDRYNEVQNSVSVLLGKTKSASEEISKFHEISKHIKKEDFELERFAIQLRMADKEKVELMKKIDTLERLISKIRRQHV